MKRREEVALQDCWNVADLYENGEAWESALSEAVLCAQPPPYWPALEAMRGRLNEGPERVKEALDLIMETDRTLSKLATYAHLRHDEDIANPSFKKNYERITTFAHLFAQESSWFQPELLALPDDLLQHYLQSPLLAEYRFYLEKMVRMKKHTLSPDNEALLALAAQALETPYKAFNAMSDADFKFGSVEDGQCVAKSLSHGSYGVYIRDRDRLLRERAFKQYHRKYECYQNTLCELLSGQMKHHLFQARARRFSSCLEAALFPKNIDPSVYSALIQAVHDRLEVLHRYIRVRKRLLQLDTLHPYDLYVPLTSDVDIRMPYEEAEALVIESVAPLGADYQEKLRRGLRDQRWVDRYENQNKRSGAYSSGCFDSMPYILMNYKDLLRDVFTLAHEAGHSMHSLYSRTHQPYHYSDYPIFLAEVASTFNEDLLTRLLLKRCRDPREKIFLLNQKIEDIRGTLFRQTMFAEFEWLIHRYVEEQTPLTPELLKEEYRKLNELYFGSALVIDPEIEMEWARIPHFYYRFYVFQYATGLSAALALSEKVAAGSESDRAAYLDFLSSGSCDYPIETLKKAGVDMTSPAPVTAAIELFDRLLSELEQLLDRPSL